MHLKENQVIFNIITHTLNVAKLIFGICQIRKQGEYETHQTRNYRLILVMSRDSYGRIGQKGPWLGPWGPYFHTLLNSLWPGDAIWQYGPWWLLVQVMACCLMSPSHNLSQCWLIISDVLWHTPNCIFTGNAQDMYLKIINFVIREYNHMF